MTTFTIDPQNNIMAHASLKEAQAADIAGAEYFGSEKELAQLAASWPVAGPPPQQALPFHPAVEDAPICATCGSVMTRNGTCYKCSNCGSTSGCS